MKKNYWKVLVLGVLVLGASVSPAHANNEGVIEENTCTAIAQRRVVDEDSTALPNGTCVRAHKNRRRCYDNSIILIRRGMNNPCWKS